MKRIQIFNNVLAYRLSDGFRIPEPEVFGKLISEKAYRKPGPGEQSTFGFIEPAGLNEGFAEPIAKGVVRISVKLSERNIPGKVVKEAVKEKVDEIESSQRRKVYAKERSRIKDEVFQSLLPRAFVTHRIIDALVSDDLIFVDTTSPRRAEAMLSLLRECLGGLPCRPVAVNISPSVTMGQWVRTNDLPAGFRLGEAFKSSGPSDEQESLSGSGIDITGEELQQVLRCRQVNQLELQRYCKNPETMLSFRVTDQLGLLAIRWPSEIADQVAADCGESDDAQTTTRATLLMIYTILKDLLADLLDAFGGEKRGTDLPADPDAENKLTDDVESMLQEMGENYRREYRATVVEPQPAQLGSDDAEDLV